MSNTTNMILGGPDGEGYPLYDLPALTEYEGAIRIIGGDDHRRYPEAQVSAFVKLVNETLTDDERQRMRLTRPKINPRIIVLYDAEERRWTISPSGAVGWTT